MRYAVIDQGTPQGGVPANILSVIDTTGDPPAIQPGQSLVCDPPNGTVAGWVFVGGAFFASVPDPVLPTISDRQFYQQLAVLDLITQSEAIAAVGQGTIPSEMKGALSGMAADQQFAATMKLTGATTFDRNDPLVAIFAAAQNPPMTSAQLDALWQAAALL